MNKHSSQTLRTLMALVLAVCASTVLQAQLRVEYFFDSDPGFGQGQWMTATTDADGSFSFPTTGLKPGSHLLGFRAYNPGKSTYFAPTIMQQIFVPLEETPTINYVEYFWDVDPGAGKATRLDITAASELNLNNVQIPTTGLSRGSHLLGIRAKGERGWSPLITQEVYVLAATTDGSDISRVEYFWDVDPGYGKGKPLPFTKGQEVTIDNAAVSTAGLTPGDHLLFVRAFGNGGWTPTVSQTVYVEPNAVDLKVLNAEYFWNEDPGYGKGTPIALTPGQDISIRDFTVPTDLVHGDAMLFVRYRGTMGWSPTVAYSVMVNAVGEYVLDATKETSLADRRFHSMADVMYDFDDRDISGSIAMKVDTKNVVYELDATDETMLGRMDHIAKSLDEISVPRDHKTIAFKRNATAKTGNSVKVTTTEAGMPTVVSLLTQTSWDNVALTINEVTYDFTPASKRYQMGCSTTSIVALSSISEAISVSWKAVPHEGTTLSGFTAQGEGDLPEMTITNSGTKMDSLAYLVTLSTTEGQKLCDYTYYIYVYAPMLTQTFSGMTPADGSSVDPTTTTLRWNALIDATGYHLTVTETADGGEPKSLVDKDVNALSYDITVKEGYTYTWTVTAIGHCDELTSPEMTLTGRVLPDLIVENITLPEAAPAGSEITVTATIKNQGQGATTEGTWVDRLYYTINSTNFSNAVQIADVQHEGNLAPDGTYEVTFTMQVPYVDSGTLRVFVEANTGKTAMEHDAASNNNRKMSTTTANMKPFYMQEDDLAALRQLYADFGGDEWNGTLWNTESTLVANSNWSGVTFDKEGYVTAINLQGRDLKGSLSTATPLALSKLTTLNLSRNTLTGDAARFINGGTTPLLTNVNLAYNEIDELSAVVSETVTTLNLEYQHRRYSSQALHGMNSLTVQIINAGKNIQIELPAIARYNHKTQAFGEHQKLDVWKRDMSKRLGTLEWSVTYDCYRYNGSGVQPQLQDDDVVLVITTGSAIYSAYPAQFHMTIGDANLSGLVDVNDVQRTLNYVINSNNSGVFSLWAANTWDSDDVINIQDIVCTVNIVLDNQGDGARAFARGGVKRTPTTAPNLFYASGRYVYVEAQDEIGAFDLELAGVTPSQVRLLLNAGDWQMQTRETANGVRLVVFSPTGQTLPVGRIQLLRTAANAEPVAVQASDASAENMAVGIGTAITAIDAKLNDNGEINDNLYDLQGRKLDRLPVKKGVYINNGKKRIR